MIFNPNVEALQTRGLHPCDFCTGELTDRIFQFELNGKWSYLGTSEIWLPTQTGLVLAAPTLIYHYIEKHSYRPPDEFVQAVLEFDAQSDWDAETFRRTLQLKYCDRE